MKMEDLALLGPAAVTRASPEVFQQLGAITRQLHDALSRLGVMPQLRHAANGLPDARSRLHYIADKSGAAANRVLNAVDSAKAEHARINEQARCMALAIVDDPAKAVASGAVMGFVEDMAAATSRIDLQLTDIMLAQDFHDLTGQAMAKVMVLAADLEDSLVKLLVQAAPAERGLRTEPPSLGGPVINPDDRSDVVKSQREVDELLANLGF